MDRLSIIKLMVSSFRWIVLDTGCVSTFIHFQRNRGKKLWIATCHLKTSQDSCEREAWNLCWSIQSDIWMYQFSCNRFTSNCQRSYGLHGHSSNSSINARYNLSSAGKVPCIQGSWDKIQINDIRPVLSIGTAPRELSSTQSPVFHLPRGLNKNGNASCLYRVTRLTATAASFHLFENQI